MSYFCCVIFVYSHGCCLPYHGEPREAPALWQQHCKAEGGSTSCSQTPGWELSLHRCQQWLLGCLKGPNKLLRLSLGFLEQCPSLGQTWEKICNKEDLCSYGERALYSSSYCFGLEYEGYGCCLFLYRVLISHCNSWTCLPWHLQCLAVGMMLCMKLQCTCLCWFLLHTGFCVFSVDFICWNIYSGRTCPVIPNRPEELGAGCLMWGSGNKAPMECFRAFSDAWWPQEYVEEL